MRDREGFDLDVSQYEPGKSGRFAAAFSTRHMYQKVRKGRMAEI